MDRKQRMATRKNQTVCRLNESARALDKAMLKAGVSSADKESFLNWAISSLWSTFKDERMNQRIMIENEVRQLGLRFPNGTVKKLNIPIAFNPSPRDLWRNIPTDKDIQYYKEDSDTAYLKVEAGADGTPRKDVVAASQRGRSHAQEGKARDDHFSLFHCEESDWYIIAVADGAGSAKYSRKGSEVACKTVVNHCKDLLVDNPDFEEAIRSFNAAPTDTGKRSILTNMVHEIVLKGAKKAHDRINEVANGEEGLKPKDFATTLMFAICKKYDFGWFIASFWVGDGAMCLFDEKNKTAKLLGTPDEGEFSGQTRFLTVYPTRCLRPTRISTIMPSGRSSTTISKMVSRMMRLAVLTSLTITRLRKTSF